MSNYSESEFNVAKGILSRSLKIRNDNCLYPCSPCSNKVAKCHSIQDNRILNLLANSGHVYMIKPDINHMQYDAHSTPLYFQKLGIHEATTFKGLCNAHDAEMFKPIDTEILDLGNPQHAFLLTYRAVIKESVVLIEEYCRQQTMLEKMAKNGLVTPERHLELMSIPVRQLLWTQDFIEYKMEFDKMFCSKTYDSLYYRGIILEQECQFAVSTAFSTWEMSTKVDGIERIIVNVFPYANSTYVLFASLPEDKKHMDTYLEEFFNSSDYYQLYILSKIILRNCENIAFSPRLVEGWSEDKKAVILQYVAETGNTDKVGYEHKDLYLF